MAEHANESWAEKQQFLFKFLLIPFEDAANQAGNWNFCKYSPLEDGWGNFLPSGRMMWEQSC